MGNHYKQLSNEERTMIQTQLGMGIKPAAIARDLGRSAATLSRELNRNGWVRPQDRCGRDVTFSDAAIQFCLMIKVLYGLPLRQCTGLVENLIKLSGLDWAVPDYSTLCRRQKTLTVEIPCRPPA